MNDLSDVPGDLLDPVARVVAAVLTHAGGLQAGDVMVVGAVCRDLRHHALGHRFAATATHDLDLALALPSWDAFRALAAAFLGSETQESGSASRASSSTFFPLATSKTPKVPPSLPTRGESLSVWAFSEIFTTALPLPLPTGVTVRVPTVAGNAAAKLGAWLDRSEWHEAKDAADLALVLYWYGQSSSVHDRLYETEDGNGILIAESTDLPLAAARLLGHDIATTIGPARLAELLARWPGDLRLLVQELGFAGAPWPRDSARREALIDALTRGLVDGDG